MKPAVFRFAAAGMSGTVLRDRRSSGTCCRIDPTVRFGGRRRVANRGFISRFVKRIVLAAILAAPMQTAFSAPAANPEDLLTLTELLGPVTRPSSSHHICGESPYRRSAAAVGGLLAALGSGAATGAVIGSKCDVSMLGMTFGLCTVVATAVGGAVGAVVGAEAADLVTGWRDCSGMLYLTPTGEIAMQLDGDSHLETLDAAARRNARVLALFDDHINRCGAAAWHTPSDATRAGGPFVGIGSTTTKAERMAVSYCKDIVGKDEQCDVILRGACNSWR